MDCDVLIVGAGPTGLVLALWLTKLGVTVRIIDQADGPGTTSRALAVQARTLELYGQLGLAERVIAEGHKVPAVNLWVGGSRRARLPFAEIGQGLTPYSSILIFPQDRHERLLVERLQALGVSVVRATRLVGFSEHAGHIAARIRGPDGQEETWAARYIAGCDGARSSVRETIGSGFPGGTYRHLFYVADVDINGPAGDGELHVDLDEADFLAVFPLAGEGRARLIGTVSDQRAGEVDRLRFDDVSQQAIAHMKLEVERVNWFSTYHVHHRVAAQFRKGRAFLLGDAAHIHSPVGGQGMNTGIGDAINLAWKLAAVLAGRAPEALLASYEAERIVFARRLVATTDRIFSFVTAEGRVAEFRRTRVVPVVIPALARIGMARRFIFRTVSQITLNYRGGPLSRGSAGGVQGGDRLPWVAAGGEDNFSQLTSICWQAHVYGTARPGLVSWCAARQLPLHVFAWRPEHRAAGLARDALYLLRPDSYVALADVSASPALLERYFTDHRIGLPSPAP